MAFQLSTKFRSQLRKARQKIAQYGVCVEYISKLPELHGQTPNRDNRVDVRYSVNVLFLRKSRRRDAGRFLLSNETEFIMAAGVPFDPKPGDAVYDPKGKRYPVDDVRIVGPDGFPILYRVRCIDG